MGRDAARIRVVEVVGNGEGGGTKCVARIVKHLDPMRFDFLVISPESPWLAEVCAQHHARYLPLPLLSSRLNPKTYREFARVLGKENADIVSAHGTRAAWYALRTFPKSMPRPKLMYSEHLFSFDARHGVARLPWKLLERYICRRADALATSSNANATTAESEGWIASERIAMRHYGVELEAFVEQARSRVARADLGISNDVRLVGTVGRLVPQKGMRYLLKAMVRVLAAQPNTVLLIVGDGELRTDLEARCRRLGIAGHVRFLGAHQEPWRILANCDVIAFSSLFEGLPQTCIEALAVGSAVVATRINGTAELIKSGQNGILVPPCDASALAEGILKLLNDPALPQSFRDRAPEAVGEYRTETMVARFEDAYRSLYAQRSATADALALPARMR